LDKWLKGGGFDLKNKRGGKEKKKKTSSKTI